MTLAIVAQLVSSLVLQPAFLLPGEKFTLQLPPESIATAGSNTKLLPSKDIVTGIARKAPASVWVEFVKEGKRVDAAEIQIPIATGSFQKISSELWLAPNSSGMGAYFPHTGRRFAELLSLNIAARLSPMRKRALVSEYQYLGQDHSTLMFDAEKLAATWVRISGPEIHCTVAAKFDIAGTLRILDRTYDIELRQGANKAFTYRY